MIRELIALENTSKVWIYPADRILGNHEVLEMKSLLYTFLESWTSHTQELKVYGNIFHHQFLGIFVDESATAASGCSIDASVAFVEQLGRRFEVDFFNRLNFHYLKKDEVCSISSKDLSSSYHKGEVDDSVLFFDHLVKTKDEFLRRWLVPLESSWHKKFIK